MINIELKEWEVSRIVSFKENALNLFSSLYIRKLLFLIVS